MSGKTPDLFWAISLILIGVSTLILSAGSLFGAELSDTLVRICGGADLCMLPVLVCTTILKIKNGHNSRKE